MRREHVGLKQINKVVKFCWIRGIVDPKDSQDLNKLNKADVCYGFVAVSVLWFVSGGFTFWEAGNSNRPISRFFFLFVL